MTKRAFTHEQIGKGIGNLEEMIRLADGGIVVQIDRFDVDARLLKIAQRELLRADSQLAESA